MPEQEQTEAAADTAVQVLDETLVMVTIPRWVSTPAAKKVVSDWFAQQGRQTPTAYHAVGYRNWGTPLHLLRIIFEVQW